MMKPAPGQHDKFQLHNVTLPQVDDALEEVTADHAAVIGMVGRLTNLLVERGILTVTDLATVWDLGKENQK